MRPSLVDPELVEAFRRDGFVVVPGLLGDELDAYGEAVTAAVHERNAADDVPLEQKSRYQQSFAIEPVFVEVPKGSVAFHHGLTVHLANPNTTDRARAVHTIITPIVWPRPASDLPAPLEIDDIVANPGASPSR